ncbi:MAG: hypothetical protein ABMA01_22880, partial [Chthoniobacteraceae bacterium]
DAPYQQLSVAADANDDDPKAARARLTAVLADLNPTAGKTDGAGGAKKAGKKAKRNKAQQ